MKSSVNMRAFTLIELLIVVAIIAILAAIAVPNFLEAQTRAKVARVQAEFRSYATAIETYHVDNNCYFVAKPGAGGNELDVLSTPISYMNTIPNDVFKMGLTLQKPAGSQFSGFSYDYVIFKWHLEMPRASDAAQLNLTRTPIPNCVRMEEPTDKLGKGDYSWFMFSVGPDRDEEYGYISNGAPLPRTLIGRNYDATNGTMSFGDLYRVNGPIY